MSDWENFLEIRNFELAWQRILRSSHYYNKDRLGLRVYEANLYPNLEHLINRIDHQTFEPSETENIYLPKNTGAIRRISVLTIDDQLVYQSLVNVISRKTKSGFEAITENHVFAHLLNDDDSPFMLRHWRGKGGQYKKFINRYESLWKKGNHWLLEADIASYYDTIDHDLLTDELRTHWGINEKILSLFKSCLYKWTSQEQGKNYSRGLPQGHQASDYLATLFLFPADKFMIRNSSFSYMRYVDDIRILTSKQDKARQALIEFDLALKKQALILQPSKGGVRKIDDIEDEKKKMINVISMINLKHQIGESVDKDIETLFFESWHKRSSLENAETALVFAINRLPKSKPARDIAIEMAKEMPWRSDSIMRYLSNFVNDEEVISFLINEIQNHKVYAWYLSHSIVSLSIVCPIDSCRQIFQEIILKTNLRWYQRLAAVEAVQNDPDSYSFLLLNYQNESNYLVRNAMLVAAAFSAQTKGQIIEAIRLGMKDAHPQIKATSVWLYLEFPDCGISDDEFGVDLGVHRNMIPKFSTSGIQSECYLKSIFQNFFSVIFPKGFNFQSSLDKDTYSQAVKHLKRAFRYHDTDIITFIESIDNFNHVLSIFISETIDGNKQIHRDQFGNILGKLKNNHLTLSAPFIDCHNLRSQSIGPHPWAASLNTWSRNIEYGDRDKIVQKLKVAYQYFVDLI